MATQSFTTDFKFNRKSSDNLLIALQNASIVNPSDVKDVKEAHQVRDVKSDQDILSIVSAFKRKELNG